VGVSLLEYDVRNPTRAIVVGLLAASLAALGSVGMAALAAIASPAPTEACPQPDAAAPPQPDAPLVMPEDYRIALFDAVWETVSELYVVPDFNGTDWGAIREEYQPYLLQTENAWEVYSLLEEMVGKLEDPASRFLSALAIEAQSNQDPNYVGIGTLVDTQTSISEGQGLRVLYVFPGSGAEEAGLQSRDRILAVNGDPCPRIDIIRGEEGTEVDLLVASPQEEPRALSVERRRIDPTIVPAAQRVPGREDIGYLRLVSLAGADTVAAIEAAITGLLAEGPLGGLVVDLRSTTLGAQPVTTGVLGEFLDGEVASQYTRVGDVPLEITAGELHEELAGVPVVVLLDETSAGGSEQFGAIMQAQDRAQVVGQQTAGQSWEVRDIPYPDGSVLQLAVAGLELPDGTQLEGNGVTPDIAVEEDWLDYPPESDPYLLEALELIDEKPRPGPVQWRRPQ
jgi:C-terminal peptidase prc